MLVRTVSSGLGRALDWLIGLFLAVVLLLALAEVLFRFGLQHSLVWVVELNRFLFIYMSFLAAAAALHHRLHFRLILLQRAISAKSQARLEAFVDLVAFAFALFLLFQGLAIADRTSAQRSAALLLPMNYVYMAVPISAVLMLVFIVLRWVQALQTWQLPAPTPHNDTDKERVTPEHP